MPAPATCSITVSEDLLDTARAADVDVLLTTGPSLLDALRTVADPRDPRGVRHDFFAILALAVCAMLTGARGYAALSRWSAQTLPATRATLGITGPIPSEKTIRVTSQNTDPDALNYAVATWLAHHFEHLRHTNRQWNRPGREHTSSDTSPGPVASTAVTVIAVDGKTVRGSRDHDEPATHLLAAFETTHGVPLNQVDVDAKTNEITHLPTLLGQLNNRGLLQPGTIVTADALHTQRSTASAIVAAGVDYVLTIKKNQQKLHAHVLALPWASMPTLSSTFDRGYGRIEERHTMITAVDPSAGGLLDFPHAAQVLRIIWRRRKLHQRPGQDSIETVYVITSITPGRLCGDVLAGIVRQRWAVENRLHYVCDTAFYEDRCRARTGHGAAVLASMRNLAITVLRLLQYDNIRAALEHHAYDLDRPIRTLQRLG